MIVVTDRDLVKAVKSGTIVSPLRRAVSHLRKVHHPLRRPGSRETGELVAVIQPAVAPPPKDAQRAFSPLIQGIKDKTGFNELQTAVFSGSV